MIVWNQNTVAMQFCSLGNISYHKKCPKLSSIYCLEFWVSVIVAGLVTNCYCEKLFLRLFLCLFLCLFRCLFIYFSPSHSLTTQWVGGCVCKCNCTINTTPHLLVLFFSNEIKKGNVRHKKRWQKAAIKTRPMPSNGW